jgi:hypothetical protein
VVTFRLPQSGFDPFANRWADNLMMPEGGGGGINFGIQIVNPSFCLALIWIKH